MDWRDGPELAAVLLYPLAVALASTMLDRKMYFLCGARLDAVGVVCTK